MLDIVVTKHANERMKERMNIKNQKSQYACAEAAYLTGIRKNNCARAIDERLLSEREKEIYVGRDNVIYRDRVFVFAGHNLVTVLPLNATYYKKMCKIRAKLNRRAV